MYTHIYMYIIIHVYTYNIVFVLLLLPSRDAVHMGVLYCLML